MIKGEESGQMVFGFSGGQTAVYDADRFNESDTENPRFTFGEMRIDGRKGHLELDTEGGLFVKPLGRSTFEHSYELNHRGFAGDCVHHVQRHFVERFLSGDPFESSGEDYLKTIKVVEACYASAAADEVIHLDRWEPPVQI